MMAQFEVELSDEVIRDISLAGKTFRTDLKVHGEGVRSPGGSLTLGHQTDRVSIHLEKLGDALVKLFVTVYKFNVADVVCATQTDIHNGKTVSNGDSQTDTQTFAEGDTQTDIRLSQVAECQTKESRVHQRFANIRTETTSNLSTQSETGVQAVVQMRGIRVQASPSYASVVCQAEPCTAEAGAQAEPVGADALVQTDMSMALRADGYAQVSPDSVDCPSQTERASIDCVMQTTLSMLHSNDSLSQTDMSIALQSEAVIQTDISLFMMTSVAMQATVSVDDIQSQTDCCQDDGDSQTDISYFALIDGETQVDQVSVVHGCTQVDRLEQVDGETQMIRIDHANSTTQVDRVIVSEQESQAVVESQESTSQCETFRHDFDSVVVGPLVSQESSGLIGALNTTGLDSSFDTSMMASFDVMTPQKALAKMPGSVTSCCDGMSQTDPVTIIIGDASFLVKKLRSSAVSPSKVTTTGNEIEIELSAETTDMSLFAGSVDGGGYSYQGVAEKENGATAAPTYTQASRGRGVTHRGGTAAGTSIRGPSVGMGTASTTSVRYQAPAPPQYVNVRQSLPAGNQPSYAGPAPVVGGTFSCPFCSLTFIDSPALYEHLSMNHTADQKTTWKQPRGREGKTIVGRGAAAGGARGGASTHAAAVQSTHAAAAPSPAGTQARGASFYKASTAPAQQQRQQQLIVFSANPRTATALAGEEEGAGGDCMYFQQNTSPLDDAVAQKRRGRPPKSDSNQSGVEGQHQVDSSGEKSPASKRRNIGSRDEFRHEGEYVSEEGEILPRKGTVTTRGRGKVTVRGGGRGRGK